MRKLILVLMLIASGPPVLAATHLPKKPPPPICEGMCMSSSDFVVVGTYAVTAAH